MLKINEGFTNRYNVDKLVYFEEFEKSEEAAKRERQIKAGTRKKKIELIDRMNSDWHDLYHEICSDDEGYEIASLLPAAGRSLAIKKAGGVH